MSTIPGVEIERKYLLRHLPEMPPSMTLLRIEQGYLPDPESPTRAGTDAIHFGRLRRTRAADGSVIFTHTIKRGRGLLREETERTITAEAFEAAWPRTAGRRLVKTRHCIPDGERTWEIDVYDDLDVIVAEIELPRPDTLVTIPSWLEPAVEREVTEEPAFSNHRLALRIAAARGRT